MSKVFEVRKYQEKAIENFCKWILTDEPIATIVLPCGLGKSLITAKCIEQLKNKKVLWVAHRLELIQQGFDTLKLVLKDNVKITIEMAERKGEANSDIIVGSVQTLARSRKNMEGFIPDLIFIDEWHHAVESNVQYNSLLKRWPKAKILGATATPFRFSGETLHLGNTLITMDIGTAVNNNYLVTPKPEPLISNISLADVKTSMGDFAVAELSKTINVEVRNKLIVDKVVELVKTGRQGIIFAADVQHSKSLYSLLKDKVKACEIYGETPTEERKLSIDNVKNGKIDVILNNMCLTEGTNLPNLSFVIMARPTRSLGLYLQCAGRGLRTSPGKIDCIIVDVFDKIKAKQSRISFDEMEKIGDISGSKKRSLNVLSADLPLDPIAKTLINFPIFIKPEKNIRWQIDEEAFSIGSWKINDTQWLISWVADVKIPKVRSRIIWVPFDEIPFQDIKGKTVKHEKFGEGVISDISERGAEAKVTVDFGWGPHKIIQIKSLQRQGHIPEHIPGQFEISKMERLFLICLPDISEKGRLLSFEKLRNNLILKEDLRFNKDEINNYLKNQANTDGNLQLVKSDAKWKKHPATIKQLEYVESLMSDGKIRFDLDTESLTKGDISSIIEQTRWSDIIVNKFGTDQKSKLLGYDSSTEEM